MFLIELQSVVVVDHLQAGADDLFLRGADVVLESAEFDAALQAHTTAAHAAFAELFQDRRVILTPLAHTDRTAVDQIRALWIAAGAEVVEMDVAFLYRAGDDADIVSLECWRDCVEVGEGFKVGDLDAPLL